MAEQGKHNDTPRTDAAIVSRAFIEREMDYYRHKFILADVARDLERQNADLLAALEAVSNYFSALDEMQPNANHSTEGVNIRAIARAALAKAKAKA